MSPTFSTYQPTHYYYFFNHILKASVCIWSEINLLWQYKNAIGCSICSIVSLKLNNNEQIKQLNKDLISRPYSSHLSVSYSEPA